MQLCWLSVTYARPYHNPTMWKSVHNIDISKPLNHTTPSTQYSWNPGFINEVHTSPECQWAYAHWSQLPRQTAVRSRPWWGWQARRWASLRQFLQKLFGCASPQFHQLSRWLVSEIPQGKKTDVEVLGWLVWSPVQSYDKMSQIQHTHGLYTLGTVAADSIFSGHKFVTSVLFTPLAQVVNPLSTVCFPETSAITSTYGRVGTLTV